MEGAQSQRSIEQEVIESNTFTIRLTGLRIPECSVLSHDYNMVDYVMKLVLHLYVCVGEEPDDRVRDRACERVQELLVDCPACSGAADDSPLAGLL